MHEMLSLIFSQVLCGAFSFDLKLKLADFSIYQSVIASVPTGFFLCLWYYIIIFA